MEQYIKALEREIAKRKQVIELLSQVRGFYLMLSRDREAICFVLQGGKYYESLLGEANIVANAYSNFGKRVTNLKRKLEDKRPDLDRKGNMASISPMPRYIR